MNRYALQGITSDAEKGKRIVAVMPRAEVREALAGVESLGGEAVARVTRANGAERIDFTSGGSVAFAASRTGALRGAVADVVYIADQRDGNDPRVVEDARLVTASSGSGEVIR